VAKRDLLHEPVVVYLYPEAALDHGVVGEERRQVGELHHVGQGVAAGQDVSHQPPLARHHCDLSGSNKTNYPKYNGGLTPTNFAARFSASQRSNK
jgi:hypothetical protein